MTLTIGRFSSPKVKRVEVDGDRVSFAFDLQPAGTGAAEELKALRQQLVGLIDNEDEPVVPVTWSSDSTFDGFYRPVSSSPGNSRLMIGGSFWGDAAITLERVQGFANPWFEVMLQSVTLTNAHSVTTPASVIAAGPILSADYPAALLASATAITRTSDGGALTGYIKAAPVGLTSYRWFATPANFYIGSCRVEVNYGGSWYPVIGRQVGSAQVWRISNGLVRITAAGSSSSLEVYDGSTASWESTTVRHYQHTAGAGTMNIGFGRVAILRNSPEKVVVQTVVDEARGVIATYTIARGNWHVGVAWTAPSAVQFGLGFTAATASTSFTGGLRATSNDANGNRVLFAIAQAKTDNVASGFLYPSVAATSGQQMFGVEFNGSSALAADAAVSIRDQWLGEAHTLQRVIVR